MYCHLYYNQLYIDKILYYFYYYENEQENDGEVVIDDLGDEVRIYSKSYIGYLDKYNFNLCIDN